MLTPVSCLLNTAECLLSAKSKPYARAFQTLHLGCNLACVEIIEETIETKTTTGVLRAHSSIADDIWHNDREAGAYEWWYFDAISDDGRDVLVVIFLANFIFSPRYNRLIAEALRGTPLMHCGVSFPAVAVTLYRDGRPLVRSISEYRSEEFTASADHPACRIGQSGFHSEQGARGTRYLINLDVPLRRGRRLEAKLAWLVREGDFSRTDTRNTVPRDTPAHDWNLVAPRCDVSGVLDVIEQSGQRASYLFRGTGYHDHNRDWRSLPLTIAEWQWGRAHFDDITAVFYRYRELGERDSTTRLFVVRDGKFEVCKAQFATSGQRRHHFGLRYARHLQIAAEREEGQGGTFGLHLRQHPIDSSFFYLRFASEATLDAPDGRVRRATAITEHLAPRALQWRWLWWLTDMRIGKNNRAAFLP